MLGRRETNGHNLGVMSSCENWVLNKDIRLKILKYLMVRNIKENRNCLMKA